MKYPWPASSITPEDMALLYAVRECGPQKLPITELLARAVRETYGEARGAPCLNHPQEKAA